MSCWASRTSWLATKLLDKPGQLPRFYFSETSHFTFMCVWNGVESHRPECHFMEEIAELLIWEQLCWCPGLAGAQQPGLCHSSSLKSHSHHHQQRADFFPHPKRPGWGGCISSSAFPTPWLGVSQLLQVLGEITVMLNEIVLILVHPQVVQWCFESRRYLGEFRRDLLSKGFWYL